MATKAPAYNNVLRKGKGKVEGEQRKAVYK